MARKKTEARAKPSRGQVIAAFELMRIEHPRIKEVHSALDDAREAGRLTPQSPKRYIELFAPSHSGKSSAIRSYIEDVVVQEVIDRGLFPSDMDRQEIAARQRLVLHVTLSPKASIRSMAADILRQLGDARADVGTGPVLLRRVYEYLSGSYIDPMTKQPIGRQTELVILDEIQHLSSSKVERPDGKLAKSHRITSTEVTDTLKTMMIRGLVPLVFVGVPEAREHLSIDVQLTNREMTKIDYSPLKWSSEKDQLVFLEYCEEAACLVVSTGLLPKKANLLHENVAYRLWQASGGCIGVVSRLLEEAVFHALDRDADRVEYEDLALAVDTRGIPNGMCKSNPFRGDEPEAELEEAA
jgi:hypothetical protein